MFYGPRGFYEMAGGGVTLAKVPERAGNDDDCRRLWELSEQLTGVSYPTTRTDMRTGRLGMPESSIVVRPEPMDSATYTAVVAAAGRRISPAIALFERAAVTRCRCPRLRSRSSSPTTARPTATIRSSRFGGHRRCCVGAPVTTTQSWWPTPTYRTTISRRLFRTLDDDPDSYLHQDAANFASAIGRSFYGQILPSKTVNLGWTSWATQWLSRIPARSDDHVHVAYSNDDAARAAYAQPSGPGLARLRGVSRPRAGSRGAAGGTDEAVDEDGKFGFRALIDAIVAALDDRRAKAC